MLQRKQTLYLLVSLVLFVLTFCFPVGYLYPHQGGTVAISTLGFTIAEGSHYTLATFIIILISVVCEAVVIFLYKNRVLQMRLVVFNILLQIGFYIAVISYILIIKSPLNADYSVAWALFLPAVTMITNYLAYRAIHKDEALVRSLNHLR